MKTKVIFVCLCLIASFSLSAQRAFLLKDFTQGKAYYKEGGTSSSRFNYDVVNQKMLFFDNKEELMDLATPSAFTHIAIGTRTFVPVTGDTFYERIPAGDDSFFYVRWSAKIIRKTAGAYGQASETSAAEHLEVAFLDNSTQSLEVDTKHNVTNLTPQYYLKIRNGYRDFTSFDALAKLFKGSNAKIKEFVAANKLSFKKMDDIKKAVVYSYSLVKE